MKPLLIWTNQDFPAAVAEQIRKDVQPHEIVWAQQTSKSNLAAGERDPQALTADVLYGQPHPQDIFESTSLQFVQLSSAGYTRYDTPQTLDLLRERGIRFCNASSLYAEPCAQHVVAMIFALSRALPQAMRGQQAHDWNYLPLRAESTLLGGQRIALVGYGSIARRVAELLAPLELSVTAYRRTVQGDEVVETRTISQFDTDAAEVDIIVNTLPLTNDTRNYFSAERFARVRPGAIYINIGRGDTNDQDALADALESGLIHQAYLDVTSPEPLPPDNRLWKVSNCFITPHTAGGTRDEPERMAKHFCTNFRRFTRGEALRDDIV